ncbi:dihydrofolate reductase family protein [Marisediminicola senii]|uniref:dihydrofolate reductase family protein n=1 Tax=Marisediminicola senii TaxID=2711233 RepID=UPI0013EB590B|nr:dihydrofolate reductase family protein [Marisediminicola senii]
MPATYTWDVFSTLDGYGSFDPASGGVDWGGYWSKQGPELLEWRARRFETPQRMVYGATTFREMAGIFTAGLDPNALDEWNVRLLQMPATVISSSLTDTVGWPNATIERGDAVDIIRRLKRSSDLPLRSQASLSLNWSLLAAGLVDRIEVTVFPVITGRTGTSPIYAGLGDYDLELLDSQTFDGRTLVLSYRPTPLVGTGG